ncbi:MAG TPA: phosphoribosylaminoimidazolesuccinocarboxamide synthase, partial [Nitrospirota bacterium]|nr:phosphoribosylaminoimidazolesuccinocarboxamide synthase [Nitrospirota bacterium]
MNTPLIHETSLKGLLAPRRGKVRDIYDLGDSLLIVATDRISAFDVVLPNAIPEKGRVLTQISKYWFSKTSDIVRNHLITT